MKDRRRKETRHRIKNNWSYGDGINFLNKSCRNYEVLKGTKTSGNEIRRKNMYQSKSYKTGQEQKKILDEQPTWKKKIENARTDYVHRIEKCEIPYSVAMEVNGKQCYCLIDTGAAVTLVNRSIVNETNIQKQTDEIRLVSVTGHRLKIFGTTKLSLGIKKGIVEAEFEAYVCDNETAGITPIILGRDFFVANNVHLLYGPRPVMLVWNYEVEFCSRNEIENGIHEIGKTTKTYRWNYISHNHGDGRGNKQLILSDWKKWLEHIRKFYKIRLSKEVKAVEQKKEYSGLRENANEIKSEVNKIVREPGKKKELEGNEKHPPIEVNVEIQGYRDETKISAQEIISGNRKKIETQEEIARELVNEILKDEEEQRRKTDVILNSDLEVPGGTEVTVVGKLKTKIEGKYSIIFPSETGDPHIITARGLIENKNEIPIRIKNTSWRVSSLKKNQIIAHVVTCDEENKKEVSELIKQYQDEEDNELAELMEIANREYKEVYGILESSVKNNGEGPTIENCPLKMKERKTEGKPKKEHSEEKVEMKNQKADLEKRQRWETDVIIEQDLDIPARSQMLVMGKLKKNIGGEYIINEPIDLGNHVIAARSLGKNQEQIPIRVINLSWKNVEIKKKQTIARAVACEEEQELEGDIQEIKSFDFSNDNWEEKGFELTHLNKDIREKLGDLLREYQDLFRDDNDKLTSTTKVKHSITLEPGAQPICQAPYRIPYKQREILQQETERLLKEGTIRPSSSPWSAPVVLVTKKSPTGEEKVRMCIDFRKLNSVTKKEYYPLPNISDLIQGYSTGRKVLFTVIDVAEAYHQIDMEEKDIPLTGFSTYQGHYEYTKMPFGLVNAPCTFQRFMNLTLSGLTGDICMVYLDDILIFNADGEEDHISKIEKIFEKLREVNIKLKPKKCNFILKKVKYLGHIITQEGVHPDPEKVEVIKKFPIPKNVKGVRAFMGIINWYRRFIPNVAEISTPLVNLTKKDVKFEITSAVLEAIDKLKDNLTDETMLIYPDFEQTFILSTDASGLGVGAILSQMRNGYEKPIAFASQKFKKAQLNYTVTEKELMGVIFGIQTFRCYLYGRKFNVITDHRPLKWLLSMKDPGSRLTRWALTLSEYDFEVIHRKGRLHGNADALSRMYNPEDHFYDIEFEEYEEYGKTHHKVTTKNLIIKPGNLFSAPESHALAHCVSKDFEMGKGIAIQFKKIFGSVNTLRQQEKTIGEVAELKLPTRNIYYMITKFKFNDKPSYRTVWNALRDLKRKCESNQDKNLALPKIACGLDGLNWEKVQAMIEFIFFKDRKSVV